MDAGSSCCPVQLLSRLPEQVGQPRWCGVQSIRGDNFHEDEQRIARAEINENDVGQQPANIDVQADGSGECIVAGHDLGATLAERDDSRLLKKARRELFDDGLGDEQASVIWPGVLPG